MFDRVRLQADLNSEREVTLSCFKMVNRTVRALAALLMVVVAVRATDVAAQTSGNAATGGTMYTKLGCETCHGPGGGGTAAGPRLAGTARQLAAFVVYVRKPTGTMPPQSTQAVSDQTLADIYAFLRASTSAAVGRVLSDPPAGQSAASAPAGRVETGAMLYRKVGCYQCHVEQAQGGANGPRLGPDPIPFARFAQYVRNPTGEMPPYTDKVLSNQDLADIYAWLQARPRPPAVSTIPQLAP
jgi:mono/diheme cytochrome c family protein